MLVKWFEDALVAIEIVAKDFDWHWIFETYNSLVSGDSFLISTGLVTFRKVYFVPARAGLVAVAALQRRNVQTGTAISKVKKVKRWKSKFRI